MYKIEAGGHQKIFGLDDTQRERLKKSLTFANPAFVIARSNDQPTDNLPPSILGWREGADYICVPRYYKRLLLPPGARYESVPLQCGDFNHNVVNAPRDGQRNVTNTLDNMSGDVGLCLPCGFGKSYLALYYAAKFGGRVLIVCPTEVKLNEWRDQANLHLGIPRDSIGHVQASKRMWEEFPVTVTMLKTLATQRFPDEFLNGFSTVIWDEAHLCGAPMMSRALGRVNGNQVTLTATPGSGVRRKLIELNVGSNWIVEAGNGMDMSAYFVSVPVSDYVCNQDWRFQKIRLAKDKKYTAHALRLAKKACESGRRVLVLNSQIEPLVRLNEHFDNAGLIVGSQSLKDYKEADVRARFPEKSWKASARAYFNFVKKSCNPILATGLTKTQPGGMGMDIADLDGGLVMFPVADVDMTQQLVGRWQRECEGKKDPLIVVMVPSSTIGNNIAKKMARTMTSLGVQVHYR
jgi:hypothetical protein